MKLSPEAARAFRNKLRNELEREARKSAPDVAVLEKCLDDLRTILSFTEATR